MTTEFSKMDGTGNDFVIIDARVNHITFTADEVKHIADRKNTITKGCDQMIVIENSEVADCFMRIFNADGTEVSACGNATRCVGWLIIEGEKEGDAASIETKAGILSTRLVSPLKIMVDMGEAKTDWQDIPLSQEIDTLHLGIGSGSLRDPVAVSMGNPHAVFFVDNIDEIDLKTLGPHFEHHELFPERANIGVAQMERNDIRLRVWERGSGETAACGTGACAAWVAAVRRGLISDSSSTMVSLAGGDLIIQKSHSNDNILMTGSVQFQFKSLLPKI